MKTKMTEYQRRAQLLADAATKPILEVWQYDGFVKQTPDDIIKPDVDGDWLSSSDSEELRKSDGVRISIPKSISLADACRVIKKLVAWIESGDGQYKEPANPIPAQLIAVESLREALSIAQHPKQQGDDDTQF